MKLLLTLLLFFVSVAYSCHPSKSTKTVTKKPATPTTTTTQKPQTPVTEAPITPTTTITTTTTTTTISPSECDASVTCDLNAITPISDSVYEFNSIVQPADSEGCVKTTITCKKASPEACPFTPDIVAVNADGEFSVVANFNVNQASWDVTCRKNGKLSLTQSGTEL
ncbi:DUF281 domain-containing protein [Caenorhabditis elegans]|uniref:DUF281 domain-containing protein n=1 Tax=Caenorhabditis elegans TaxID=6239 RepID=B1GRN6_CAEEL|nr:DUF281 domain-containing protein [Caenorhabditis elegans]CAQ16160.1 DUF281 domain-containing protein [Caenorhabditis elegans]|eukprot:NP_001123031.1 Uncharacterized protein CELE_Y102A5C.40 [Caenorhabditis elegans]